MGRLSNADIATVSVWKEWSQSILTFGTLSDHEKDLLNLALVQYTFDGAEQGILPWLHGNAKGTGAPQSYVRTVPSKPYPVVDISNEISAFT